MPLAADPALDLSISCREMVELVTAYLEGALPERDRARFDAHLELCQPCVDYLAQMRHTIRLSGLLREDDLEPDAKDQLLGAFRDWKRESATEPPPA